jgi:hypothetical protein
MFPPVHCRVQSCVRLQRNKIFHVVLKNLVLTQAPPRALPSILIVFLRLPNKPRTVVERSDFQSAERRTAEVAVLLSVANRLLACTRFG